MEPVPEQVKPVKRMPPQDYGSFVRELTTALDAGAFKTAISLLVRAKPEWSRRPTEAETRPVANHEVIARVLRSAVGSLVVAGCTPAVRRKGKGVSQLARDLWWTANEEYA